jgi:DNA-binding YbaB/EbfC family protein
MAKQPNLNQMMRQVQQMQAEMMKAQEELKNEVVEASAGGGMVTVKISGDLELKELRIDPEAVDPEDVELLQDDPLRAGAGGEQDGRRHRWAGRSGRPGRAWAAGAVGPGSDRPRRYAWRSVRSARQPSDHRARPPARRRTAHRAAARFPRPQRVR